MPTHMLEQGKLDRYVNALMRLFNPAPANVDVEAFQEEVKKNARRWLNTFTIPNPLCGSAVALFF
jgi:hypothetical protein